MKKITIKLAIGLCFYALSCVVFANNQLPSSDLQAWIEAQMRLDHIPGASIALIKNYQIEWARGFGFKNKAKKERVTGNTLFQAASVSESVTALAAIKAFEEKQLPLESDVDKLLTTWKIPNNSYTAEQPVTLRLLLSHSAGITDFRYKGYGTNVPLPTLSEEFLGKAPANTPAIVVVAKPGSKYAYAPASYTIIQQVLTDLYNQSFDKIMEELVLNPLKMKHSTFAQPLSKKYQSDIALPYSPNGKLMPNAPLIYVASAPLGLWSTPTDLAKFVIALQEAIRGRPQNGVTQDIVETMLKPGLDPHMGLGFEVNLNQYGKRVKNVGTYFMRSGFKSGYSAVLFASKMNGNGVVIMLNSAPYVSGNKLPHSNFLNRVIKHISKLEKWSS